MLSHMSLSDGINLLDERAQNNGKKKRKHTHKHVQKKQCHRERVTLVMQRRALLAFAMSTSRYLHAFNIRHIDHLGPAKGGESEFHISQTLRYCMLSDVL